MRLVPIGTCLAQPTQLILGTHVRVAETRKEEEMREQRAIQRDNMAVDERLDPVSVHLIEHALFGVEGELETKRMSLICTLMPRTAI